MLWNVVFNDPREIDEVKDSIQAELNEVISGLSRNENGLIVHFLQEPTQAQAIATAELIGYQGMVRIQEEGASEYLEINV